MRKVIKYTLISISVLALILLTFIIVIKYISKIDPPVTEKSYLERESITKLSDDFTCLSNNWIHKNRTGFYEMYLEGNSYEIGLAHGRLTTELMLEQEQAFANEIEKIVPSSIYRYFLKYLILFFNRNLDKHLSTDEKLEIYGVSKSANGKFNYVGSAYQRMMNYHAAHDIGHALQNMNLVGCSSFAVWNDKTKNGDIIIGRNFDFYVGDDFAKNKIIAFIKPDKGIPFMMVTWAGMTGVVSGMNQAGLTVTINAAKSDWPTTSATPVSILAREILQYASTIDEAFQIARKRQTFVSESFLIGSEIDNQAAVIEKSPSRIDIYKANSNQIVCTNHFESETFQNDTINQNHKQNSASGYRYLSLSTLLDRTNVIDVETAAKILRNPYGINGKSIGYMNEKAINQFIAHHGIIFNPTKKTVWVSTPPYQLGAFIAYNLDTIFSQSGCMLNKTISIAELNLEEDKLLSNPIYQNIVKFKKYAQLVKDSKYVSPKKIIDTNPDYFYSYELAGDVSYNIKDYVNAIKYYNMALGKEIPNVYQKDQLMLKISKANSKLK